MLCVCVCSFLVKADGSDLESERLVRHPVVGGEEVDERQLGEPLRAKVELRLALRAASLEKVVEI